MSDTIAIVGLGLMGGSLALALKRRPGPPRVIGVDRDQRTIASALAAGAIDEDLDLPDAASAADVLVLATPVRAICDLMRAHAHALAAVPVLTDIASVKAMVQDAAREAGLVGTFVGGHPMTGREQAGFGAARADLYDGAPVWLCPSGEEAPIRRVAELWSSLGARPARIGAVEHDALVARTSHTPQIVASALGLALSHLGVSQRDLGPGGRDTTRLAASPESLWSEILVANKAALAAPLDAVLETLHALRDAVLAGDEDRITELMRAAREWKVADLPDAQAAEAEGGSV